MHDPLCCAIALSQVEGIGPVTYKAIIDHFGSAQAVFSTPAAALQKAVPIKSTLAHNIQRATPPTSAEALLQKAQRKGIKVIAYEQTKYPSRLKRIYNPPPLLYVRHGLQLEPPRVVAIVGSRHPTTYGLRLVKSLVGGLEAAQVTILSGLAYGIDVAAHQAALAHNLPTWAILGSGLDHIYPACHGQIAACITDQGDLISEYEAGVKPAPHHFPARNRLIAGLADVVVVVEAAAKSGALITAQYANHFGREVLAFPGNTTSPHSVGCHQLIKRHQAHLISEAADLTYLMNWAPPKVQTLPDPSTLTPSAQRIVALLANANEPLDDNSLGELANLSPNALATELLQLSMRNIVELLPGQRYQLHHLPH